MNKIPPAASSQPSSDLPFDASTPTPTSSGTSVTPKLACAPPKNRQNEV
jgi:hypothetical protein